ncbi:MAG TPA: hypothetical protein VJA23_01855 [Candidatus Nanoarchaeia archaeon]|nr:hypothetical protein [Candidatus Nanoarchaeia archaeon]
MNKILFFDSGPIISLVMSRLIWILPELKKNYGGKFMITPAVRRELIERPLGIKRFEFEALQVMKLIREGVLEVYEKVPASKVNQLETLANGSFKIKNKTMDVVQSGELEIAACALETEAEAVVMDERTLRLFIENNKEMTHLLKIRFNQEITADQNKMNQFSSILKSLKIIRSVELVGVAYQLGLLDAYIPDQKGGEKTLLDAVLWATKFNGCAVTEPEIEEMEKVLLG